MVGPSRIGSFRVLEQIGEGGMGQVWAGLDEGLRRKVALKTIKPVAGLADQRERLVREARILSRLDHPNICRVYELIEDDEGDTLVLELIDGSPLGKAMRTGLSYDAKLRIASQIASALVAAHAEGVVHRDLKPANVMLTPDGTVKVLDFGLARATGDPAALRSTAVLPCDAASLALSQEGLIVGTPGYLSPEQARSEPATPASDMYSFGLLLQELFTGKRAMPDDQPLALVLTRALNGETARVAGLGKELTRLINALKSLDPGARPTALEASQRLQRLIDAPRRRLLRLAAAAAVLLVVAGAGKYTLDLRHERAAALAAREAALAARAQAEGLVEFMLDDLYRSLEPVGRLELLDKVARQALAHYVSVAEGGAEPAGAGAAVALEHVAEVLEQQGRLEEAREALSRSEGIYRRLQDAEAVGEWRAGLARVLVRSGALASSQGDTQGAVSAMERGIEIARALIAEDPSRRDWQLELARGRTTLGMILGYRGEMEESLAAHREALAVMLRLVAAEPGRPELVWWLATTWANLCDTQEISGDLPGALASAERSLELFEGLQRASPGSPLRRWDLARAHYRVGCVLEDSGRIGGALEAYVRARDVGSQLIEEDAANARWRSKVADYHSRVGRALELARREVEAAEAYRQAVRTYTELAATDASNADWKNNLAWNLVLEGRLDRRLGRQGPARSAFERAVAIVEPAARASQDVYLLDTLLAALVELGRFDDARPLAAQLRQAGWSDPVFLETCRRHGL